MPWRHAEGGGTALPILNSALDDGEWSATRFSRFKPGERAPGTHWKRGWVGPKRGMDIVEPSHYTDWAIQVPLVHLNNNLLFFLHATSWQEMKQTSVATETILCNHTEVDTRHAWIRWTNLPQKIAQRRYNQWQYQYMSSIQLLNYYKS
jgi:hypothetical protein